jgi:uncharacterized protein (DUF488 family)
LFFAASQAVNLDLIEMFYRRKVLLALLQSFGGKLEKIALQKLLFLMTQQQDISVYYFVPFAYGGYSISANADLTAMDDKSFWVLDKTSYFAKLTGEDQQILSEIKETYQNLNSTALMRHTYLNFSYYAINSKTAKDILSENEYAKVRAALPASNRTVLFTIGYEGISLEEYLNRLIQNDVKVLIDVRCNPVSMKFGFSQKSLKSYCEKFKVEYLHLPNLGIRSEYRQGLNQQSDYNELFRQYQETTLKQTTKDQNKILQLLKNKRRIALTCFESDINKCHRKYLADSIRKLSDWKFELEHI